MTGRPGIRSWLDPRGRHVGLWAFTAGRVTGVALVCYLYLHLIVLSLLVAGPGAWNGFVRLAAQPAFLALDVVLIAGLLVHGLHGLRVALLGSGLLTGMRGAILIALATIGVLIGLTAAVFLFT